MALALSLPPLYPSGTPETYTLHNIDTNACSGQSDISFHGLKRLNGGARYRIDVHRGQLTLSSDKPPLDVVCKIGCGTIAKGRIFHEASLYTGKLSHLQGECIPHCHGYFVGDTGEGPTACILLTYCGEPIQDMLMHLPPAFKTGLVNALVGIHDAGVKHLDLSRGNILDYHGGPMIIDFEDALEHECGRHVPIEEGAPGPSKTSEIGCRELYQFFMKLNIWTPAFIRYTGRSFPIKFAFDARTLAKMAPSHWSHEEALQEANRVIVEHVKTYYPEHYDKWRASFSEPIISYRSSSSVDQSSTDRYHADHTRFHLNIS
ncbi:hypothetical protein EWM64_g9984 [Hericium alpestre]|uniref:Protein kinase domain-containing protein n=1 Tax=Hericium alpestre TaxID=135208 RepID=A0A4Y9ZK56_9AGAM|nr:hypothetical protein EWM64_g9984 [Hericium alpestre]